MRENILCIIFSLLTILMNYAFLRSVLRRNIESNIYFILLFLLFAVSSIFSIILRQSPIVKMLIIIISTILVMSLVFKISLKKSLFLNLIFTGVYTSIESIAYLILQEMNKTNGIFELTDESGAFIAELVCQFVMLTIVLILNVAFRKNTLTNMDFKGWFIFLLFPIFTLTTIIVLTYGVETKQTGDMFNVMLLFSAGQLILNLLLFLLLDNVIGRENELRNKERLLEQSEYHNQMYQSLSDEREKQKARSHDYLNHLNVMLILAKEGKNAEQIEYIKEQIGKEVKSIDVIDTGNPLINAVLNIKYMEAKEKKIVIPFIADNLSCLNISDSDLVTILANILDNAIEAVQKCEEKKIIFKILRDNDMLIVDSSNPYVGHLPDYEAIGTTKLDKKNHGYGIANIKDTVAANHGNCFIETTGSVFHITVAIPLD